MNADLIPPISYESLLNALALGDEASKDTCSMEWLDQLPVKVVVADAAGKADYWNKEWYEYTGLPIDYPKNKLWKAALHPDDIQRTYNGMSYSVRTGSELQIEYRLRRASDEQYRWHLARVRPVKNSKNEVYRWLAVVTDIHDQKEAEYNKDIFLSVASHELKTPITALKTLLHLYKSEIIGDNDACPNMLEQAENQLIRIERLVGNLLDLSKVNANKMVYRFEEFNFGEMLEESIERMQQQTGKHTIVLEQNAKVLYNGDRLRLEQVVNNLLSNAIKYSPAGNKIVVRSYVLHNEIYISVQDFGIGIAPDDIEKIYTAYYRANNKSSEVQGLGIGLYICSEIIKNHLGKLWVQSVPEKGSTFYLRIPLSSQTSIAKENRFMGAQQGNECKFLLDK